MQETFLHSLEAVPLSEIVREEYRLYQIYTLMDRAIPYLRDGLKPVQRRILYMLWKNQSKGLMKVSSATGIVLTLHPHGPASVEAAMVNLAQDYTFANNYPLIDKKGYFGERMEPVAAASRYIECKLGKVAQLLLFDDMNQVEMIPNYDERSMEPVSLRPKLPLMLLNGSEGIGTGFSSTIPSFHHSDIIKSMIAHIKTGKPKKIRPWVRHFKGEIQVEKQKVIFKSKFEEVDGGLHVTEVPRGYDAKKINKWLIKWLEKDYIKDYIDSTVDNDIDIELQFKRGKRPSLEEAFDKMGVTSSLTPNYTLISDKGVKIFKTVEEIIGLFTDQRLEIVKRRYELLCQDTKERINQNNEIIRFIKQRHYAQAEKCQDRSAFVKYLKGKKFSFADYLADMAIYRMTKDEVKKRQLMVKDDTAKLKEYQKVAKSKALVKKKLEEELLDVDKKLADIMAKKEEERKKNQSKKQTKRKRRKK